MEEIVKEYTETQERFQAILKNKGNINKYSKVRDSKR